MVKKRKDRLPSIPEMAENLAKDAVTVITDGIATGSIMASEEMIHGRLLVCDICPKRQGERCLVCGCFINKKARLKAVKCPLDKWGPVKE